MAGYRPALAATAGATKRRTLSWRSCLWTTETLQQMSSTTASQEELKAHRVPLAWRDQCSAYVFIPMHATGTISQTNLRSVSTSQKYLCGHVYSLLLPLNVCRKDKYYLPWECENERHAYEKCVSFHFCRRCFVHLVQLLRGRCQYDEYVSLFLHIGPYIDLKVFTFSVICAE